MPSPRLKRRRKKPDSEIPESVIYRLEHGEWPADLEDMFEMLEWADRLEEVWKDLGDDIVKEWAKETPGTRPWGWWYYSAPSEELPARNPKHDPDIWQRRLLKGEADSADDPEAWFGIPALYDWDNEPGGNDIRAPIELESEARYLRRLGLLLKGEKLSRGALKNTIIYPDD